MGVTQDRREVTFESGGLKLEGILHFPPYPEVWKYEKSIRGVVVAHPHPQYGGDMYNSVVQALCEAALEAGAAALRFNFRGVGFSEGRYDEGVGEQSDLAAAIEYLRGVPDVDAKRVAVAGYSFGATVVLRFANGREDLPAVVSVANPTQRGPKVEIHLPMPALFITGDRDQYCDAELLQEYRTQIGDDVTINVVPGVDHFWSDGLDRLKESATAFFSRHV